MDSFNYFQSQFDFAKSPVVWYLWSERLFRAGEIIFNLCKDDLNKLFKEGFDSSHKNLNLVGVDMLLFGYAIENCLKAVVIKENPEVVESNKIKWGQDGHDLLKFAEKIRLSKLEEYKEILHRLTQYIRWAGRYPIPKNKEDMSRLIPVSNEFEIEQLRKIMKECQVKIGLEGSIFE